MTFITRTPQYQRHDFGAFDAEGHQVIFKIDHYEPSLTAAFVDPSDERVTERTITIMLSTNIETRLYLKRDLTGLRLSRL